MSDFSIETLPEGAVFRIERPAKLNAITRAVMQGLSDCLDQLEARRARLLVITGSGERAFCAGTDLAELQGLTLEARIAKSDASRALLVRLHRSRVMTLAAMNGLAFGGGLELAMASTLRMAAQHVTMALPEVKLGLVPAYAGTQLLPSIVGKARALEIMMTGRTVGSAEALSIGLVHRLANDSSPLIDQALAFAREITRWSPGALAAIRACVDAAGDQVSDEGLAVETRWVNDNYGSDDAREGTAAFLEKRPPRFSS